MGSWRTDNDRIKPVPATILLVIGRQFENQISLIAIENKLVKFSLRPLPNYDRCQSNADDAN